MPSNGWLPVSKTISLRQLNRWTLSRQMLLGRAELDAGWTKAPFLVDGIVAGSWDAPLRGRAVMSLAEFAPLSVKKRQAVEREAESLLAWLRPDSGKRELVWKIPTNSEASA